MQFTKIRCKDGRTLLRWSVANEHDREFRELASHDEPEAAFTDALAALRADVLEVLELPPEYADKIEITALAIDRDKHDNRGFVLSARCVVAAGKFAVSTPRLREPGPESDESASVTMASIGLIERTDALCGAAARYAAGHRTQTELDLGDAA